MQKLASMLFALCVLGSTGYAAAQMHPVPPPNPPTQPGVPPMTGTPSAAPSMAPAPAPATPAAAGQPNFGELISSLNNMRAEIAKVQALSGSSVNSIRPVNVAKLPGSNSSALSTALSKNQTQLAALRNALGRVSVTAMNNQRMTVAQFLADNKINLNQVVGADVNNGTLVLFYQK